MSLGCAYEEFGLKLNAKTDFQRVIEINPNDPDALAGIERISQFIRTYGDDAANIPTKKQEQFFYRLNHGEIKEVRPSETGSEASESAKKNITVRIFSLFLN